MSASLKIIGPVRRIEPIAVGSGIRELALLRKLFGRARWRKLKGEALVRLPGETYDCAKFIGMKRTASAGAR